MRPTASNILCKSSAISQQKTHKLPSGEHKTACFFNDQAKTVAVCLGSSDSLPGFIRHFTFVFHLFWSLQNSRNGKDINFMEDCKKHLQPFFVQRGKKFWEDGIMKFPGK